MSDIVLAEYTRTFQQIGSLTGPVKAADVSAMAAEIARLRETKREQADLIHAYENMLAAQIERAVGGDEGELSGFTKFSFLLPNAALLRDDTAIAGFQGFFKAVIAAVTGRPRQ